MESLQIEPGSVTILALINDPEVRVELVVDTVIWEATAVACHPLINTSTLVLSRSDLRRFLERVGHKPTVLELPARETHPVESAH